MIEHIQGIKGYPSDNLADFTIADCNNVYVALFLVSMTFESACASALIRRQAAQPFCCVVHSSSFNSFPPHSPQLVAKFFAKGATAKFATFLHSSLSSSPPDLSVLPSCSWLLLLHSLVSNITKL